MLNHCGVCNYQSTSALDYEQHLKTDDHKIEFSKFGLRSASLKQKPLIKGKIVQERPSRKPMGARKKYPKVNTKFSAKKPKKTKKPIKIDTSQLTEDDVNSATQKDLPVDENNHIECKEKVKEVVQIVNEKQIEESQPEQKLLVTLPSVECEKQIEESQSEQKLPVTLPYIESDRQIEETQSEQKLPVAMSAIENSSEFEDKRVVYFGHIGYYKKEPIYKYGISSQIYKRIQTHKRTFEVFVILYIKKCDNNKKVESLFKHELNIMGLNRPMCINGKTMTELFTTSDKIDLDAIKNLINKLIDEHPSDELKEARAEIVALRNDKEIQQIQLEMKRLEAQVEFKKLDTQIELKKIEFSHEKITEQHTENILF
jgi:hypothetical protein